MTASGTPRKEKPDRRRQWLWFVGLWCGGLAAAFALGGAIKLFMALLGLDR